MNRREFNKLALLAVGGLLTGTAGACGKQQPSEEQKKAADAREPGKHACKGFNDCKGKGGCKSGDNGCAGKNSCKGKGGCSTAEKHACAGKNDCKAQGGCKSGDNGCAGKNSCKGKGGCGVPVSEPMRKMIEQERK